MVSEIIVCSAPMVTQVSTSERLAPPLPQHPAHLLNADTRNVALKKRKKGRHRVHPLRGGLHFCAFRAPRKIENEKLR